VEEVIGEKVPIPKSLFKTLSMVSETIDLSQEFADFQQNLMGWA